MGESDKQLAEVISDLVAGKLSNNSNNSLSILPPETKFGFLFAALRLFFAQSPSLITLVIVLVGGFYLLRDEGPRVLNAQAQRYENFVNDFAGRVDAGDKRIDDLRKSFIDRQSEMVATVKDVAKSHAEAVSVLTKAAAEESKANREERMRIRGFLERVEKTAKEAIKGDH